MDLDRADGAAGGAGALRQLRRRPARSQTPHQVQHPSHRYDLGRGQRHLAGRDRRGRRRWGRSLARALRGDGGGVPVGATGTGDRGPAQFRRGHALHQPVSEGRLRLRRQASGDRRHRLVRGAGDACCGRASRAPVGVPALGGLLHAGRQPALGARRVRGAARGLRHHPRRAAGLGPGRRALRRRVDRPDRGAAAEHPRPDAGRAPGAAGQRRLAGGHPVRLGRRGGHHGS